MQFIKLILKKSVMTFFYVAYFRDLLPYLGERMLLMEVEYEGERHRDGGELLFREVDSYPFIGDGCTVSRVGAECDASVCAGGMGENAVV